MMSEALWTTAQRLEIIFGRGSKASEYFAAQAVAATNNNCLSSAQSPRCKRKFWALSSAVIANSTHAKGIAKLQETAQVWRHGSPSSHEGCHLGHGDADKA